MDGGVVVGRAMLRNDLLRIVGFRALGPSTCGQGVVLVSKVSVSWLVSHVKQKVGLYVKRARLVSVVVRALFSQRRLAGHGVIVLTEPDLLSDTTKVALVCPRACTGVAYVSALS